MIPKFPQIFPNPSLQVRVLRWSRPCCFFLECTPTQIVLRTLDNTFWGLASSGTRSQGFESLSSLLDFARESLPVSLCVCASRFPFLLCIEERELMNSNRRKWNTRATGLKSKWDRSEPEPKPKWLERETKVESKLTWEWDAIKITSLYIRRRGIDKEDSD